MTALLEYFDLFLLIMEVDGLHGRGGHVSPVHPPEMDMCMHAAWVGGLPGLCPGISKSLVTPLLLSFNFTCIK